MKKYLLNAAGLMLMAFGCFAFTACGDDEPETPGSGTENGGSGDKDDQTDSEPENFSLLGLWGGAEATFFYEGSVIEVPGPDGTSSSVTVPSSFMYADVWYDFKNPHRLQITVRPKNSRVKDLTLDYEYTIQEDYLRMQPMGSGTTLLVKFKLEKDELKISSTNNMPLLTLPEGYPSEGTPSKNTITQEFNLERTAFIPEREESPGLTGNYVGTGSYFGGGFTDIILVNGFENTTSEPGSGGEVEMFMSVKDDNTIYIKALSYEFYYTYEVADNCLIIKSTQYEGVIGVYKYDLTAGGITFTKVSGENIPMFPDYTEYISDTHWREYGGWTVYSDTIDFKRI